MSKQALIESLYYLTYSIYLLCDFSREDVNKRLFPQTEHRWQTTAMATQVSLGKSVSLLELQEAGWLKGSHIIKGPLQGEWQLRKGACIPWTSCPMWSQLCGRESSCQMFTDFTIQGRPCESCKFPCILNLVISFYELPSILQEGMFQFRRNGCRMVPNSKVYE